MYEMTNEFLNSLVFLTDDELKEFGIFEFLGLLKTCNVIPKGLRMCWRPEQADIPEESRKRWFFIDDNHYVWAFGYDEVVAFQALINTLVATEKLPKAKTYDELVMKLKLGWKK